MNMGKVYSPLGYDGPAWVRLLIVVVIAAVAIWWYA